MEDRALKCAKMRANILNLAYFIFMYEYLISSEVMLSHLLAELCGDTGSRVVVSVVVVTAAFFLCLFIRSHSFSHFGKLFFYSHFVVNMRSMCTRSCTLAHILCE